MVTSLVHNLSSLGSSKYVNNTTMFHTYIQNNTGSSDKHMHRYIHHTLSFMHKKEQYIVKNKHVEQGRS